MHPRDRNAPWRALWARRPVVERWLINGLAGLAHGLARLALISMRGLAWRVAAGAIGIAAMGWLLTDATRALMADAPAQAGGETAGTGSTAASATREPAITGAIRAGTAPVAAPEWVVEQPKRMGFDLRLREVQGEPVVHTARRERHSGTREETISAGRFEGDAPWLVLSLVRGIEADARLAVALARRAAERGIVLTRGGNPGALATKFGPVEAADITLGGAQAAAHGARACIGFRHAPDAVALTITGWFCGTATRPADRATLACLIERIGVSATGDDPALRQHFARAELNRQSACNPAHLNTAGRRTTWLDPSAGAPPLRRGTS